MRGAGFVSGKLAGKVWKLVDSRRGTAYTAPRLESRPVKPILCQVDHDAGYPQCNLKSNILKKVQNQAVVAVEDSFER